MQENKTNQIPVGSDTNVFVRDFRNKPLTYVVQAIVVILFIANLWVFTQLAPLVKDLALISQRVDAAEIAIVPKGEIQVQFEDVKDDLARMERKIDALIDRELQGNTSNRGTTIASSAQPQTVVQPPQSTQSVTVVNPQPAPNPAPTPQPTPKPSILDILPFGL